MLGSAPVFWWPSDDVVGAFASAEPDQFLLGAYLALRSASLFLPASVDKHDPMRRTGPRLEASPPSKVTPALWGRPL